MTRLQTRAELYEYGKSLRTKCSRQAHGHWRPPANRPDPIALLEESGKGRIADLVPIRNGRMLQSPFAFYRGAALNMAADLAGTPNTGLRVQSCGDAHLANFGLFATPERREIFEINDFDETLPAPWEWDVKRLAASFVLACRHNNFADGFARKAAVACVASYRKRMAEFSRMSVLDVWYSRTDAEDMSDAMNDPQMRNTIRESLSESRHRSAFEHHFPKVTEVRGRGPMIQDNPPLIFHWNPKAQKDFFAGAQAAFVAYKKTLEGHRQVLLSRYELKDVAIKVVGVGSVGTWCGVGLLMAGKNDPLFLQIKEAGESVLERFAGKSVYRNHGERVVVGYRLMQSASDIFLGWAVGPAGRHFYVRQLRDVKIKIPVETLSQHAMKEYARLCGLALARAHARTAQPAAISGYLGKSDKFDKAIGDFSMAYADQMEHDHKILVKAVRHGRIKVVEQEV